MNLYRDLLAPGLFRMSPDRSHAMAHAALRRAVPWRLLAAAATLRVDDPRLVTRFAGVELPNPVGLAAGFDKDAELIAALSCLGFGFVCVGSIMPEPRVGNPFPRLVRRRGTESIADSMGVPSKGRAYATERLRRLGPRAVPVIANIGGFSADTIAAGVIEVAPHVDLVELSLMCPNVLADGEVFDEIGMLRGVLARLDGRAGSIVVRVPNDTTRLHDRFAELIEVCIAAGVGGIKVGGGRRIAEPGLGTGAGTLHGREIFDTALMNVERAAGFARGRLAIKGNGGISSAADVLAMRRAGASCVDLYSAFIYQGWTIARDINRALAPMWGAAQVAAGSPAGEPKRQGCA
ncbi:dihydroorotate oxidase B, catalytic subunit [Rhodopseudomonas palustris HaA2]|uniref:Dihydroorotate oxidase B, catalytic subunit n=1 Tax=Rhodopseudomonas palustris (strain HaA2) TaxID=316058 RepID=Q2IVE7_RHOP2|nr:dihydroorotate oxidase [Rhodopseudomonas palustris]ABD07813.1 dihydroorotate oxidase B, catalytic subunit [Rhodopseudomonas palustris HaA2]